MLARFLLRRGRHVPDDDVGARQAPQLQERVQGLPEATQVHHSIRHLSLVSVDRHKLTSAFYVLRLHQGKDYFCFLYKSIVLGLETFRNFTGIRVLR